MQWEKKKTSKEYAKRKRDEENILSKDIEDDNICYMMETKKYKTKGSLKSSFTLKNLTFKPPKYKGSYEDSFKQNSFSVCCSLVQEKSLAYS